MARARRPNSAHLAAMAWWTMTGDRMAYACQAKFRKQHARNKGDTHEQ